MYSRVTTIDLHTFETRDYCQGPITLHIKCGLEKFNINHGKQYHMVHSKRFFTQRRHDRSHDYVFA